MGRARGALLQIERCVCQAELLESRQRLVRLRQTARRHPLVLRRQTRQCLPQGLQLASQSHRMCWWLPLGLPLHRTSLWMPVQEPQLQRCQWLAQVKLPQTLTQWLVLVLPVR